MGKEGVQWGVIASVYSGMQYGMERVRGKRDWKNALLGGALTGALLKFGDKSYNRDKMIEGAITGAAVATTFEFYLNTLGVLPQLRVMQNTKVIEPFTAHYVFALGVVRFLSCLHRIFQVIDTRGLLLVALGRGAWPAPVLLSEVVQTFILADFCYYYVKSVIEGKSYMRLLTEVV
ncbi:hypothetical protein GOP47_0003223 [Adiantum capillus-veneris]|uniref:Uncharacterized protein n=1 Tax=Adiantum capillus-veneris TaxID=13818 RepID=A0A9D4VCE8_ADICA|nr:hypothetical protein GOP47_0003223 [Adiantum capillus-veneris]